MYYYQHEHHGHEHGHSCGSKEKTNKQIIISFKTNFQNLFTIIVIELDKGCNKIILRNEIYHMWEQFVKGLLLDTGDFLILSQEGTRVIRILPHLGTKKVLDYQDTPVILHPLHESDYLKINQTNHILFSFSLDNKSVEIKIMDIYK